MPRPENVPMQAGVAGWDSIANDNFSKILDTPYPIPLHSGDQTDLEATYPAASYDKCWVFVEHTVDGWTIYESDGTNWAQKEFGGASGGALAPIMLVLGDETTTITTGAAKLTFRIPDDFTLTAIFASLSTASSSGDPQIDVNLTGTGSIFSTPITIDANEKTSLTAVTPPVITTDAFSQDDEITVDIDAAGTGAKGLKIYMIGTYNNILVDYSLSEKLQGYDWHDGKPIYRKTIAMSLPNNNTITQAHSITTIDEVVKMEGRYQSAAGTWRTLPRVGIASLLTDLIELFADGTNVYLRSTGNHSAGTDGKVDIYYTKT